MEGGTRRLAQSSATPRRISTDFWRQFALCGVLVNGTGARAAGGWVVMRHMGGMMPGYGHDRAGLPATVWRVLNATGRGRGRGAYGRPVALSALLPSCPRQLSARRCLRSASGTTRRPVAGRWRLRRPNPAGHWSHPLPRTCQEQALA